jgi:hypothetical protein
MACIVRALPGYGDIPANFPIIVDEGMAIIEPAFAYLHDMASIGMTGSTAWNNRGSLGTGSANGR